INERNQTLQSMWEQRDRTKCRQIPRAFYIFRNHDSVSTGQRWVKFQVPGSSYLISLLVNQLLEASDEFNGKVVGALCAILLHSAVYSKYLFMGKDEVSTVIAVGGIGMGGRFSCWAVGLTSSA